MNSKNETLRKLIREEIRKELKEGKLADLIIRLFFKNKIKKGVEQVKNDPDVQEKIRSLEFALQDLKDTTERTRQYLNSPEYKALSKKYGYKDWA